MHYSGLPQYNHAPIQRNDDSNPFLDFANLSISARPLVVQHRQIDDDDEEGEARSRTIRARTSLLLDDIINGRGTIITPPKPVKRNHYLLGLYRELYENSFQSFTYTLLSEYDNDYSLIMKRIKSKNVLAVDAIYKVNNPYLKKAYELKKEEKQLQYEKLRERLLFHGTKGANIDNICKYNFDWRLHSKVPGIKYGEGVSFTPNAKYASNYSDSDSYNKVMLVAYVLTGASCAGNENMILPCRGCDTARKGGGLIIIKFDDNEFYPAFRIDYHMRSSMVEPSPSIPAPSQRKPKRRRRKKRKCQTNI